MSYGMKNQITWGKDQRVLAAEDGKTLFAVGIDGRPNKGCKTGQYITTGLMDDKTARLLFLFGCYLADGLSPKAALSKATNPPKAKARSAPARREGDQP